MWRKGESLPKYLELKGDVEQAGKGAGEMAQCKRACLASRRPEFSSQHLHKKAGYGCAPTLGVVYPNTMGGRYQRIVEA